MTEEVLTSAQALLDEGIAKADVGAQPGIAYN